MIRDRPGKYHLYHEAVQATWLGLVVNLLLGCAKLAGGVVGQSYALISDAVNSLGDVFTSIAVLLAFRVAQKPADAEHPYGHTRAEAIAGSNVAVLVIVSALLVGWGAVQGFSRHVYEVPPVWTLAIAASNVVIKEALYQYKIRLGRRAGSSAIIANAWDHRADAFSALAVLVGLLLARTGGPGFLAVDEIAALVVVAVIRHVGDQASLVKCPGADGRPGRRPIRELDPRRGRSRSRGQVDRQALGPQVRPGISR